MFFFVLIFCGFKAARLCVLLEMATASCSNTFWSLDRPVDSQVWKLLYFTKGLLVSLQELPIGVLSFADKSVVCKIHSSNRDGGRERQAPTHNWYFEGREFVHRTHVPQSPKQPTSTETRYRPSNTRPPTNIFYGPSERTSEASNAERDPTYRLLRARSSSNALRRRLHTLFRLLELLWRGRGHGCSPCALFLSKHACSNRRQTGRGCS